MKSTATVTQHTAGPWRMVPFEVDRGVQILGPSGEAVGRAQLGAKPLAVCESNARLMAASPELLEACQLFTAAAHEVRDILNGRGFASPSSVAFAAEKARNAIEKAMGVRCKSCGRVLFIPSHGEYARCEDCLAAQHEQAEKATGVS